MATAGPNGGGSASSSTGIGSKAWNSPTEILSNDMNFTFANLGGASGEATNWLIVTSFGFSIPSGATIDGISFTLTVPGDSRILDNAIRVYHPSSGIGSTDKAIATVWSSLTTRVYGGISDLWGESWSHSNINSSSFGVAISAKKNNSDFVQTFARYVTATITYTEAASGQPAAKRMGGIAFAHGGYQPRTSNMRWRHDKNGLILPSPEI